VAFVDSVLGRRLKNEGRFFVRVRELDDFHRVVVDSEEDGSILLGGTKEGEVRSALGSVREVNGMLLLTSMLQSSSSILLFSTILPRASLSAISRSTFWTLSE